MRTKRTRDCCAYEKATCFLPSSAFMQDASFKYANRRARLRRAFKRRKQLCRALHPPLRSAMMLDTKLLRRMLCKNTALP